MPRISFYFVVSFVFFPILAFASDNPYFANAQDFSQYYKTLSAPTTPSQLIEAISRQIGRDNLPNSLKKLAKNNQPPLLWRQKASTSYQVFFDVKGFGFKMGFVKDQFKVNGRIINIPEAQGDYDKLIQAIRLALPRQVSFHRNWDRLIFQPLYATQPSLMELGVAAAFWAGISADTWRKCRAIKNVLGRCEKALEGFASGATPTERHYQKLRAEIDSWSGFLGLATAVCQSRRDGLTECKTRLTDTGMSRNYKYSPRKRGWWGSGSSDEEASQ